MNLVLFEAHELNDQCQVTLTGRRAQHIQQVLKSAQSDKLKAGVINGKLGRAHVCGLTEDRVEMVFEPLEAPPEPANLKLILALPRPKVLSRVIIHATTLGIKDIFLINAFRVEKPYWSSDPIHPDRIRESCWLGLEQARDTIMPRVHFKRLFKPFVEDELPAVLQGTKGFVAHPGVQELAPSGLSESVTLAIGPEGGFIPYEVELLKSAGMQPIHLGERILKVETAIPYLVGRMLQSL